MKLLKLQPKLFNKNIIVILLKKTFEKDNSKNFAKFYNMICVKNDKNPLLIEIKGSDLSVVDFRLFNCANEIADIINIDKHILKNFHIQHNRYQLDCENFDLKMKKKEKKIFEMETYYISFKNLNKKLTTGSKSEQNKILEQEHKMISLDKNFFFAVENKKKCIKISSMQFQEIIKFFNIKLYDLFILDESKKIFILINYNEHFLVFIDLKGLVKNVNFNSIFHNKKLKKLKNNFIHKNESFDCDGNIIFLGERVQIISGKYIGYIGIIRFIHKKFLFISSVKVLNNYGMLCIKSFNVRVCFRV